MAKEEREDGGVPSPFQFTGPQAETVQRILRHLELLRVPIHQLHLEGKCSRDCHLLERNHTVDAIKHFIEEGCITE